MIKKIKTPANNQEILNLNAGDIVHLSGILLTARDAAHKRMIEQLDKGLHLPFDIN